jgi:hypothetical protein
MGRGEVRMGIFWGDLRERDHLKDLGVDGRIEIDIEMDVQNVARGH